MPHQFLKFIYFDVGMILDTYPDQFVLPQAYSHLVGPMTHWFIIHDEALCAGEISLQDSWTAFCKVNNCPESIIGNIIDHITACHRPRQEMHELAHKIRKQYSIGLLTNMYPGLLSKLRNAGHIPPFDWFSTIVDSSVIHMTKPNRPIYEYATTQAGFKPEEIAFVDDRLNNVEAAREYGWTAWHFNINEPEQTIKEIAAVLL